MCCTRKNEHEQLSIIIMGSVHCISTLDESSLFEPVFGAYFCCHMTELFGAPKCLISEKSFV